MDSIQVQISKIYANAMLEVAVESKAVESVEKELLGVSEAIYSDSMIWDFLASPKISKSEKEKVIEKSFSGMISGDTLSFLKLLLKRDRIIYIKEISNQFLLGHDDLKGRIRAFITSAQALEEKDLKNIEAALVDRYKGECILEHSVSPELIGGMVIRFKDNIIDSSFKTRLGNIKRRLLENKTQSWSALYEN
ncbi:MAG: ATP synthase F1 subunit delta [Leptospiraceae bacterium]|nr:ATP synthase F1 subunit delta [Leptospiraceae bacterium]MCK6381402.1 ATP synthase F1 subunit delta [Leptospiraceae bacterium]NUM42217.1 ATP synthase F1 subunit delta [Leptospiraceae bacterium]